MDVQMTTTRQVSRSSDQKLFRGLLGAGSAGNWDVAVDQSKSGRRTFLQIEGPTLYAYFEVPNAGAINEIIHFFESPNARVPGNGAQGAGIVLGNKGGVQVSFLHDDEFEDRCFLIIEKGETILRFTLSDNDVRNLLDALKQIQDFQS